jgi:o-succinylbenzoate synthase
VRAVTGSGRPGADPGDALIDVVDAFARSPLEKIRIDVVAVPLRVPVGTATGAWTTRRSLLVTLRDADGAHGTGEIAPAPGEEEAAIAVLASLAHRLDGLAPAQVLAAIEEDRSADRSAELALASVLEAGLETALLDLAGRRAGLPVAGMLAGASGRGVARLRVPVSALVSARGLEAAAAAAQAAVARGIRCVKVKVGGEPDAASFAARIAAVRAAVGDDVELRLDANGAWTVDEAVERLRAAASSRIAYVEQPVADVEGLAAVRAASPVPVAADETVRGAAAARRLVDAGAVDVLVVKPARVGGAVETLRIAVVAADAGVPVVLSTFYETGIGLAAALHIAAALPAGDETHGIATADLLASDLLAQRPRVAAGWADVPDASGLGVETSPDLVAEFRESAAGIR